MLRLSRILNYTRGIGRQLHQNATKYPSLSYETLRSTAMTQLNIDLGKMHITPGYHGKKEIIDIPVVSTVIENPRDSLLNEIRDIIHPQRSQIIEIPSIRTPDADSGIQAARLIVIRRRKMKKHKLRKLRKKMKFEWAKVRQKREMRKEKRFQAGLLFRIKKAEAFSAEEYVNEKLRQANEIPIPRYWKGRRLPQFIIKEKMGIK